MNKKDVLELVDEYDTQHVRHFGWKRKHVIAKSGTIRGYKQFEDLLGYLRLSGILPSQYFSAVMTWMRNKGVNPSSVSAHFVCTEKARDIASGTIAKAQRVKSGQAVDPLAGLEERIDQDIKSNVSLVLELEKTYGDSVRARQVGASTLSPYFWCVDILWSNNDVQQHIPEARKKEVLALWSWFQSYPKLVQAARKSYYDSYVSRTGAAIQLRSVDATANCHQPV